MSCVCLMPSFKHCDQCYCECSNVEESTLKDLRGFSLADKIGSTKHNLKEVKVIAATTPNKKGLYPYRKIWKSFSAWRIKWASKEEIESMEGSRFLKLYKFGL
jgi:hypothetical protein